MRDEQAEAVGEATPPACEIHLPVEQSVPFVFNSPHSGRSYPEDFLAATSLDANEIRRSEDFLVERDHPLGVELAERDFQPAAVAG